jgi:hypothetical protein
MVTGRSYFEGIVSRGGYAWMKRASRPPCWILAEVSPLESPFNESDIPQYLHKYALFETEPALFKTFAQLPLDNRDALLAFANEYGYLGIKQEELQGESLEDWIREINDLREGIALWEMVRNHDLAGLRARMRWQEAEYAEDGSVIRCGRWSYPLAPKGQWVEKIPELFQQGDIVLPARVILHEWINVHIRRARPRLVYDPAIGRSVFVITPHSLLSALWLQFAESISDSKRYRTCKGCGKVLEISTDERTARRLFCSAVCKVRDYRRRKERAQHLKENSKSLSEIAKELDTDLGTIKKWLKQRKG